MLVCDYETERDMDSNSCTIKNIVLAHHVAYNRHRLHYMVNKTPREWLQELDEPYRTQAINNCDDDWLDNTTDCDTLFSAITNGFIWTDTPEGWDYWSELADQLEVL